MKKIIHLSLFLFYCGLSNLQSQVVLNELSFGGFLGDFVELKNLGPNTVDVSDHFLFTAIPSGIPSSVQLSNLNLACGSLIMEPGDIIVFDDVSDFLPWQSNTGDLALYSTNANDFEIPSDLVDYLSWGLAPTAGFTQDVAVAAGQWTDGDFIDGNWNGLSLEYDGTGNESSDWPFNNMPTICAENASTAVECEVVAGMPNIGQFEFCVGDGIPDVPTGLMVSGNVGLFSQWVVTDVVMGAILELPNSVDEIDFDNAPGGSCAIWHVAHDGAVTGLEVGAGIFNLGDCHALSNPVIVNRIEVDGGTLEGGPFDFCVGDDEPDFVSGIT